MDFKIYRPFWFFSFCTLEFDFRGLNIICNQYMYQASASPMWKLTVDMTYLL